MNYIIVQQWNVSINIANLKVTKNADYKFTNIDGFIKNNGYFLYTI